MGDGENEKERARFSPDFTHYSQSTSKISLGDCRINNHTTINLNQCAKYKRADFFFCSCLFNI